MKTCKPVFCHSTVILAAGLASVLPLIVFWRPFHELYFFHDDWELLEGAARSNLWAWLLQPFLGESLIPVFKLLWLGALQAFGGSYFAMICLLWATHLANCLLLGWLLARFSAPPAAIAFAVLTFGLAWSNIETLGWSVQWGSQLALLFFLVAWHWLLHIIGGGGGVAGYALCLVASALTSSRGIISGLLLGLFLLFTAGHRGQKMFLCGVSVTPTLLATLAMVALVGHGSYANLPSGLSYAAHYYLLNPLYHLVSIPHKTVSILALCFYGFVKIGVIVWALRKADERLRPLLLALVAFDLLNAVALGFGRYHTGINTSVSSRYQYISLLCFGPAAGLLVARSRLLLQAALFLVWVPILAYPWNRHAPRWAGWRGSEIRDRLAKVPDSDHFDPSSLTAGRARALTRLYQLH